MVGRRRMAEWEWGRTARCQILIKVQVSRDMVNEATVDEYLYPYTESISPSALFLC